MLCGIGCGRRPTSHVPLPSSLPADPWKLISFNPSDNAPAWLSNGLIGIRIGKDGSGFASDGRSLPFFKIDEYQPNGEEKIYELQNPLGIRWTLDGRPWNFARFESYRAEIDMRDGVLRCAWHTEGGKNRTILSETIVDPTRAIIASRWTFSGGIPGRIAYWSDWSRAASILSRSPSGFVFGLAPNNSLAAVWEPPPTAHGQATVFERVVSFGANPKIDSGARSITSVDPPKPPTFEQVLADSKKVCAKRWKTDIEIEGPPEDQLAIRSFLFYLRSAIHPSGKMSVSPFSLSNRRYNGHVFWDADTWVFPALAFVDPMAARAISAYRLKRTNQGSGWEFPTAEIRYSWESSVTGNEVAPEQFRHEIHITGDVAFSLTQASALGLADSVTTDGIVRQAGAFYDRQANNGGDERELKDVLSPDENHFGNNDLYTNLLAQWCSDSGSWRGTRRFKLPHDGKTFLTYDSDPLRAYKQAAAVLAIYPLQYPTAEREARAMMERFADKVSPNGPAMSDSVHALIWARLGETDKAYATWRKSWQDFTRAPLMLFSEKRNQAETYFTTGAAGCLQTVLFGFLGFRVDTIKESGAQWSKKLNGGRWLSIRPNLPKAWKSVKFKNFCLLGKRYTLSATHNSVQVTQGDY